MHEIKKIQNVSLANITAAVYGLVAFFIAIAVAISTMANIVMQKDFAGSVIMVTLFNIGAGLLLGVVVSLITAVFGWLIGYLSAMIYNMFAQRVGGIRVELAEVAIKKRQDRAEDEEEEE